jgi:hypothetical protein
MLIKQALAAFDYDQELFLSQIYPFVEMDRFINHPLFGKNFATTFSA